MEVSGLSFDERVAARAARFGLEKKKRPAEGPPVEDEPRRRIAQLKITEPTDAPPNPPPIGSRVVQITGSWQPAAAPPALAATKRPPPTAEQASSDVKRARDAAAGCARPEAPGHDRGGRAIWLEKVRAISARQESDSSSSQVGDREAVSSWIPLPKRKARQRS